MLVRDIVSCQFSFQPADVSKAVQGPSHSSPAPNVKEKVDAGAPKRLKEITRREPVRSDGEECFHYRPDRLYRPRDLTDDAGGKSSKRDNCPPSKHSITCC